MTPDGGFRVARPTSVMPYPSSIGKPAARVLRAQRNEPMWDIDEPGRKTSSDVSSKAAPALAIIQRSESFEWVTPFDGPVLPEVKKIAAASVPLRRAKSGAEVSTPAA